MTLGELVGLHVVDARKTEDGDIILNVETRAIRLTPAGDCCATCYIQHVDGSEVLTDATITAIERLEFPVHEITEKEQAEADVLDGWGHRIHTTKGICTIDMRVAHNGDYGGKLDPTRTATSDKISPILVDF